MGVLERIADIEAEVMKYVHLCLVYFSHGLCNTLCVDSSCIYSGF